MYDDTILDAALAPATPPPAPAPRKRYGALTAVLALACVAVGSLTYGAVQHSNANVATQQRLTTEHTLAQTRQAQHETQQRLEDTQATVDADQQQLGVCLAVSKAARQLFRSSQHLTDALTNYPYGVADIDAASANIDAVTRLVNGQGYTTIDALLAGCTGEGGIGSGV